MIFSRSAPFLLLSLTLVRFLQWSYLVVTSERTVVLLGGSRWKCVTQAAGNDAQQICLWDRGCCRGWFRSHGGRPLGTEQRGESLMAQLTLSDISDSQMAFFSSANGFNHQQKRQPREEETISTSNTWVTVQNTRIQKHTLTQTSTHGVRVQRLISVTTRVESGGHLAPTLQPSFWPIVVFINLVPRHQKQMYSGQSFELIYTRHHLPLLNLK